MPAWMKDYRKAVPLGVVIAVLAALLATAPRGARNPQGFAADGPGATPSSASSAPVATGAPSDKIVSQDRFSAPASKGKRARLNLKGPQAPGSGKGAGGGGATYKGVLDKTVKVGFTWQHAQCGNFFGPSIAAAFGVPQPNEQESITAAIEYFERFPEVAFPDLPSRLSQGISATKGYWGRRVQPIFEDNGGPVCSDKARATAVKLAEQDKVFGTVQIPNDGANEFIAPEMAAHKLINIGAPGLTRDAYKKWEPYVYDVTFSGSDVVDAWTSWACRDLVGKASIDTGDPTTAKKTRVFGVVYPDLPNARALFKETEARFKTCGAVFASKVAYSADIDQQASSAANAIAQFRANGVTSVYMMTDPLFSATLTSASTGQSFYPEWVVSSLGFNDVAFVVEHFYDKQQQKNVSGASHLSTSVAQEWTDTPQYKAWKMVRPNEEPPGDWNNWYLQILVLYAGMAGAGPDLAPVSFEHGVGDVCGPCARASKKDIYLGFGPGDMTGVDDFTIVRFNPSKENKHDPGDGTGRPALGDWDFPENGLRYYRSIDRPER